MRAGVPKPKRVRRARVVGRSGEGMVRVVRRGLGLGVDFVVVGTLPRAMLCVVKRRMEWVERVVWRMV